MHINSMLNLIQGLSDDSNSFDDSGSVSKSDSDAASNTPLNWQSHSHPVALMGLEVKLEGQAGLCGTLVCNSHSPIPSHDLQMSSQVRVALNVG